MSYSFFIDFGKFEDVQKALHPTTTIDPEILRELDLSEEDFKAGLAQPLNIENDNTHEAIMAVVMSVCKNAHCIDHGLQFLEELLPLDIPNFHANPKICQPGSNGYGFGLIERADFAAFRARIESLTDDDIEDADDLKEDLLGVIDAAEEKGVDLITYIG